MALTLQLLNLPLALALNQFLIRHPKIRLQVAMAPNSSVLPRLCCPRFSCKSRKPVLASSPPSPPPPPPPPSPPSSPSSPPLTLQSPSVSSESSVPTSSTTNYEVFLSFRGPDTRKGFADYLYTSLINVGVFVFRDNNDLEPGEKIDDALVQSIKQSRISIPIISRDYASSRSCLMELAQMLECKEADGQLIVPVFYDVNPTDLKYQRKGVEKSFLKHEDRGVDRKVIDEWKQALRKIAEMKGYDLENTCNGHQGALIDTVVSHILKLLKKNDLDVIAGLVDIEPHVREVMKKLGVSYVHERATEEYDEYDKYLRVLGICGMPGVGKTTVAKVVCNKIHHLFERCSFLLNVRENYESNGSMGLQEQLISDLRKRKCSGLRSSDEGKSIIKNSFSNVKVLILLDDVHDSDQIEGLVGNLSWFGRGSRILMTFRRTDVLPAPLEKVADKYEVGKMGPYQALQLFHLHAFGGYPREDEEEYDSLSRDIVSTIGGIPFALKVTGSYLHRNRGELRIWQETFDRLKSKPEPKVHETIKVSYDSLDRETKEIFLDIACFFIGTNWRIPWYMWHACEYYPSRGIKLLCNMALVKIGENNELSMHNLLREFGREIVWKDHHDEPQKRSRLWKHTDALSTLDGEESAVNVEALGLKFGEGQSACLRCERFDSLKRLRFLRLDQATIGGSSQNVLSNLRWLDWQSCSHISELLIFHLEKLVILDLSRSLVTGDSQEWGQTLKKAKELEVLNLSSCRNLNEFPDIHTSIHLKQLVLEHCSVLPRISQLKGNLKNLVSLNLKFCTSISDLPRELSDMKDLEELLIDGTTIRKIDFKRASMKKLKILSACQCEKLDHLSESIGHLESLEKLQLDGAIIDRLPDSIGSLKKLRNLLLGNCQKLTRLPHSIGHLESLEVMNLSSTQIKRLPKSVERLKKLKVLKMENTHLREFPKDIKNLEKLEEMDLSQCWNLKGQIHCDMRGLFSLKILRLPSTKISSLPWSDGRFSDEETLALLPHLQQLDLSECDQLRALRRLPSSLSVLRWGSKKMRMVPDLSYLRNLRELYLGDNSSDLTEPPQIGWLTGLVNLEILELCLSKITLPEDFSELQLRKLVLHYASLRDLRELPSSLLVLCLQHCRIQDLQFSTVRGLSELELRHCHLGEIVCLEDLRLLELLKICHCNLQRLDGLENLARLRKLTLSKCLSLNGLVVPTNCKVVTDVCNH